MNIIDEDLFKTNLKKLGYEPVKDTDADGTVQTSTFVYVKRSVLCGYQRCIVVSQTPYCMLQPVKNFYARSFLSLNDVDRYTAELKTELGYTALDLVDVLNGREI